MAEVFERLEPERRRQAAARLVAEADGLLGIAIEADGLRDDVYPRWLAALASRLEAAIAGAPAATETRALMTALAGDARRPAAGFLDELAEILFLERQRRSEYLDHPHPWPPYRISKLLLEYATWSRRIDALLGVLTKGFCATDCDRPPTGCCHILGYDLGLVPEGMLALQRLEARRRGFDPPAREDKCRYHTDRGCVLSLFKSPACAGHLCDRLLDWLRHKHPPQKLDPFLEQMTRYRNCDLDRQRIFAAMEAVVEAGRRLVA